MGVVFAVISASPLHFSFPHTYSRPRRWARRVAIMTDMLKKLRRAGRDSKRAESPGSRRDSAATLQSTLTLIRTCDPDRLSFFGLPAELRNYIYDLVASSTVLTLPTVPKKQDRVPPETIGLLLTSRQARHEYSPLLLSTAPVVVDIKDFEFKDVIRVVSSLYSTELKALRQNQNLVLRLKTQNCTKENLASLRRWLVNRSDSLDRLPWRYEIQVAEPASPISRFRLSRELLFYTQRLSRMGLRLEDTLKWELQTVLAAFGEKMESLGSSIEGANLSVMSHGSNVRGLSGGGLR